MFFLLSSTFYCTQWVGEPSSGRLAPEPVSAPAGHVAAPDPLVVCWFYRVGGPGPLWGLRGLCCQLGASLPLGHVASPDPSPHGERVRGCWPGEARA